MKRKLSRRQVEWVVRRQLIIKTREGEAKQLRRVLSGDVDNIVMMAMRKQPEQRYASVAGVL